MTRSRWLLLAAVVVALLFAGRWVAFRHRAADELQAMPPDLQTALEQMIIPTAELRGATAGQTVAWLNRLFQQNPELQAWKVELWPEPALPAEAAPAPAIPGLDLPASTPAKPPPLRERTVTLSLTGFTLYELLRYIASMLGCSLGQQKHVLYLVDGDLFLEPLVERKFRGLGRILQDIYGPLTPATVREDLRNRGLTFPPGARVRISGDDLFLRNTQDNLDLCTCIISDGGPSGEELTLPERITGWFSDVRQGMRHPPLRP